MFGDKKEEKKKEIKEFIELLKKDLEAKNEKIISR